MREISTSRLNSSEITGLRRAFPTRSFRSAGSSKPFRRRASRSSFFHSYSILRDAPVCQEGTAFHVPLFRLTVDENLQPWRSFHGRRVWMVYIFCKPCNRQSETPRCSFCV
ncbi:hypothetical protein BV25DRAFT_1510132 [Artomyces pyxidatus]|uniref:Uncharacterized protein n=1 Tax=Artomyces pyxidatus TaxID=48021 RepID=A0ACB8TCN9_9AGAM|nr:hypothetical protein BV25DRAFT_1510132 [Artomyces pyxidatus]